MIIKRLAVYLCAVLIIIGLELLLYFVDIRILLILYIGLALILLGFLKFFIKTKVFSKDFFYLSLLPLLLLLSIGIFLLILGSDLLQHFVIGLGAFFLFLFLENLFLYYYQPVKYQPHSLENLSALLQIIVFFLLVINLVALNIFLNLPIWLLSIILLIGLSLILLQAFWIYKLANKMKYVYLFIINIIILEYFWALFFLPTNFFVSSIILTIIFYFIWGIFKAKINDKFSKKLFWRYLIISCFLLFCVIATNSWI